MEKNGSDQIGAGTAKEILARIDQRLHKLGLTERRGSLVSGMSSDAIRTIRRQIKQGVQHRITERSIGNFVRGLQTNYEWLAKGNGDPDFHEVMPRRPRGRPPKVAEPEASEIHSKSTVAVTGEIMLGTWRNPDDDQDIDYGTLIPADPRLPAAKQAALLVRGNSVNAVAQDGDFLIYRPSPRRAVDDQVRDNDLVVVRRRLRSPVELEELTVRRYRDEGSGVDLVLDSTDARYADTKHPRYEAPIRLGRPETHEHVEIVGVVIALYRAFPIASAVT